MDSGTLGSTDDSREKRRWGDGNKFYTRKNHHKGLKNITGTNKNGSDAADTTTGDDNNNDENNKNENRSGNNDIAQKSSQTLATEEANSSQQRQNQSRFDAAALDDSSRLNLPAQVAVPHGNEPAIGNGNGMVKPVITRVDDRVKINLGAARSKSDIRELRRKLNSELDQVRSLVKKLEGKEAQLTVHSNTIAAGGYSSNTVAAAGYSHPQYSANDVIESGRGLVRVNSDVGSVARHDPSPFTQLSVSMMDNNHGVGVIVEKEKRTPKVNQYYRNSDFLLGKDRLPPESNKKLKSNSVKKHGAEVGIVGYGFGFDKNRNRVFRSCSNLLQRLMKHKHGWVFNEPVNAKALGLHDYHDVIKHPMDLGTIKTRLAQNWYKSPREFAEDVRLTFRNAMTYNPKGQDVHVMAEQLSKIFEERWAVIESEYNPDWRYEMYRDAGLPTPPSRKDHLPPPAPPVRALDRSESMTTSFDSKLKPSNFTPVGRTPVPKKPKANDPNKRDMTYEEKQRLSTNLQSLPSEKLDAIVQIIKKRNSALCQHDDEIEVDIDNVDAETLWELDRFVTNYRKSLSKIKRKAELALQARAEVGHAVPLTNPAPAVVEVPKEIGTDTRNVATTLPVQREKQGDNVSRSSSSSSSSSDSESSSSDSDSDSSSAYGSDAGHSPKT